MRKKYELVKSWIGVLAPWALVATLFIGGFVFIWAANLSLPSLDSLEKRVVSQSTKIYDRTGEILLFDVHGEVKRQIVPFEEISRYAKNATVAIEDAEFYEHNGIKPSAILRASIANLMTGEFSQGGSTITQQVIKNALLISDKKISRKLKEWVLAPRLEKVMSKEEILELYLNEIPYGGNIYGIEEASRSYFGKNANDLNLTEAAYLAALPQAPTFYSPYGNNTDRLEVRKNLVLSRMLELDFITKEEFDLAKEVTVLWRPRQEQGIKAPHFVEFVRSSLEEQYGKEAVLNKGLVVTTTLDWDLQQSAQEIVSRFVEENTEKFNATNAGMVVLDPKSGDILAMVGSKDYFDRESEGNFNVTLARRQPGSSFKPFVYATAFDKGYTPETVVFNLQTQFDTSCNALGEKIYDEGECYQPVNYDGEFSGPMTLRNALAQSVNIPAIKTLYLAGLEDSLRTAKNLGISTLTDIGRYGLTLVLGGGEVTLLEITSAYSAFANDGEQFAHQRILRVEDNKGNVLAEANKRSSPVLAENTARLINDVLSDNTARAPAFGENSLLYIPNRDVAVKTGTTNDYRDAWIIGYSPNIAVGVWAGNNDNSSMEKRVAGFIVAPMWNAFMQTVLAKLPNESFVPPQKTDSNLKPILRGLWRGGENYFIDSISGKLATELTPEETRVEKVKTSVHSILYWVDKNDLSGDSPDKPSSDPQFNLWETPVRAWVLRQGIVEDNDDVPDDFDDVHTLSSRPKVTILSPEKGYSFDESSKVLISLKTTSSKFPITQADFFLNDTFLGSSKRRPFSFSFIPGDVSAKTGSNKVKIIVYDSVRNKTEETVKINVSI